MPPTVPLQTEATAGLWRLTVHEVITGDDAVARVTQASASNVVPPDGLTYLVARVTARNAGTLPYKVDSNDFSTVGASGIVRRYASAVPPGPALDGIVAPGESLEGWIACLAEPDVTGALLLFDSASLHGDWADTAFALSEGAALPTATEPAFAVNEAGREAGAPAGPGDQVVTKDWAVELLEVRYAGDVVGLFPASDYRTTALASADPSSSASWLAFRFRVTHNRSGDRPRSFPPTAFTLAGENGDPLPDFSTLSSPLPDIAGEYLPSASAEGWVLFDALGYGGSLLRFQPYRSDGDPRFIDWSGAAAPEEPSFEGTLSPGTVVVVTEEQVRLRSQPSTDSEIIAEMNSGTELTITGEPQEGSGYTWYPVEIDETGQTGYVVQQFIQPKS